MLICSHLRQHSQQSSVGLFKQLYMTHARRLHAQGNKWACPGGDSIDVCSNLDEVQLGDLKCVEEGGLADSATSRYAVIDLLRVMPTSEDCPEQEPVSGEALRASPKPISPPTTSTIHTLLQSRCNRDVSS